MDVLSTLEQLGYYQPENYRTNLSADTAHINITNDGAFDARDLTDRTFGLPGLKMYVVANGVNLNAPIDSFAIIGASAEDFDLGKALQSQGDWMFREARFNDLDQLELIFLRKDARRIEREGLQDDDLQIVRLADECDTFFAIITASDDRAWVVCQNWLRSDGRQIIRVWEIADGQKQCLHEKESVTDNDEGVPPATYDWWITYYLPPAII